MMKASEYKDIESLLGPSIRKQIGEHLRFDFIKSNYWDPVKLSRMEASAFISNRFPELLKEEFVRAAQNIQTGTVLKTADYYQDLINAANPAFNLSSQYEYIKALAFSNFQTDLLETWFLSTNSLFYEKSRQKIIGEFSRTAGDLISLTNFNDYIEMKTFLLVIKWRLIYGENITITMENKNGTMVD